MKPWVIPFILLIFTINIYAANYYVSKSGNDINPGTEAQPWQTIQKAADTLAAGDTVYIKSGTYKEIVEPKNSGTPGKYITYTVYPGDTVTINGNGVILPSGWGGLIYISEVSYIKIIGLRVINAGPDDNHAGILLEDASYITLQDNYTYNTASSGIGVWDCSNIIIDNNEVELACNDGEQECISVGGTNNFEIKNNHVHHNGPGTIGGEGICPKDGSYNGKVFFNHVHHLNDRLGIYVDAWDKLTYNIEIYQNVVHDISQNDCFTLACEAGGLLENITITNNIGYNADFNGMNLSINGDSSNHPMKNIKIINNTFYRNGAGGWGGGIAVENPDIQNVVIRNNILSLNITYQMEVEPGVSMGEIIADHNLIHGFRNYVDEIKGSDYVEGDPLFANSNSADFHLKENSPAIDKGSSQGAPDNDYDGSSRPQGNGFDIGAYEYQSSGSDPRISLSTTSLNFTVYSGSTSTVSLSFTISNSGAGTLDWSIQNSHSWFNTDPQTGTDSGSVTVAVDPTGLSAGSYTGTVTVSSSTASNSPQNVAVNLTVKSLTEKYPPFGSFDTPTHGSTVSSSIPVTGWALDDTVIEGVDIYREPLSGEGNGLVFIGDAVFVEGARPDIIDSYPGYPNNSSAGWGYMMLTNFLPNGGNGTFTLHAIATDAAGNSTTLGTKTIHCDNANAVKPFGAIDTPVQGGTASGGSYINWGWALTPQPNHIPTDGSTLKVWVDGVNVGQPTYNIYRKDIAALFPSYANSHGAIGYFLLDTTTFENGIHSIQWTVIDSEGNSDGIGSRYFIVQNASPDSVSETSQSIKEVVQQFKNIPADHSEPIKFIRGFNDNVRPEMVNEYNEIPTLEIKELERIQLQVSPGKSIISGNMISEDKLYPLPIGSTLKNGIFSWSPGPGFLGRYRLVFVIKDTNGVMKRKDIFVHIGPKF